MTDVQIKQMPGFKKAYKKLPSTSKSIINEAILSIVNDPELGTEKKGDLAEIFVYNFKIHHKEFLLAYEWDVINRTLLALGVHENFYRDLKRR